LSKEDLLRRVNRVLENRVKMTRAQRQVYNIGDCGDDDRIE